MYSSESELDYSEDHDDDDKKVTFIKEPAFEDASLEPSISEWSSLLHEKPIENVKRLLFNEGLYKPGSGKICTKYIALSDSEVLKHPYYNYPVTQDNGIEQALFEIDPSGLEKFGAELYMAICQEMYIVPCRMFSRALDQEEIDLKYYGLNPSNVRAMCLTLEKNKAVKRIGFADNFLDLDACYHLGQLLIVNDIITCLDLTGCRIGPGGVKRVAEGLPKNKTLKSLLLNRNCLTDVGMEYLCEKLCSNTTLKQLDVSYNRLGADSAKCLNETLMYSNKLTHLNLSWNEFYSPPAVSSLLQHLSESKVLQELMMSWTGMGADRIATGLKKIIINVPTLRLLDISNNRIKGTALNIIINNLNEARRLHTLNLSYNPLSTDDALKVLQKVRQKQVTIKNLFMDEVRVTPDFMELKELLSTTKGKKDVVVTHGGVTNVIDAKGEDPRSLLLMRCKFLCDKVKKKPKPDVGVFFLDLNKVEPGSMQGQTLQDYARYRMMPFTIELLTHFELVFPGKKVAKGRTVDITAVADYVKRLWPLCKPTPTPPPTPPPEPEPPPKKGKGKK